MTLPISSFEQGQAPPAAAAAGRGKAFGKLPAPALLFIYLKRFIWVPVLHTFFLLLGLPLILLQNGLDEMFWYRQHAEGGFTYTASWFNELSFRNPLLMIMALLAALVWAALMFNYLNDHKAATYLHSLPFSRTSLFSNGILACLAGISAPVLIAALCCILLRFYDNFHLLYSVGQVAAWAVASILISLAIFSTAVFFGMFTGVPLVQTVFTIIFNLLPPLAYVVINYLLYQMIFGYPSQNNEVIETLLKLPFTRLFILHEPYGWYLLFLLAFAGLFLAAALWAYRRRPLERAGDIIVFPQLRPVFKYGVAACTGIFGGTLMAEVFDWQPGIFLLCLWGLLGYGMAAMLLQKSIRIHHQWKGAVIYCLVVSALITGIRLDLLGYERRVPAADQIQAVLLYGISQDDYAAWETLQEMEYQGWRILPQVAQYIGGYDYILETEAGIQAALSMHRQIIADHRGDPGYSRYNTLTYIMKNGTVIRRQYRQSLESYPQAAAAAYNAEQGRRRNHHLQYAQAEDISWMRVRSGMVGDTYTPVLSRLEMASLLAALQEDMVNQSYAQARSSQEALYSIEFSYEMPELDWPWLRSQAPAVFTRGMENNFTQYYPVVEQGDPSYNRYDYRYFEVDVYNSFSRTLAWLAERGYDQMLLPQPGDLQGIRFYKGYNFQGDAYSYYWQVMDNAYWIYEDKPGYDRPQATAETRPIPYTEKELPPCLTITDTILMARIINQGSWQPYQEYRLQDNEQVYRVDFVNRDGYTSFTGYYYDGLPSFLTEQGRALEGLMAY